MQETTVMVMEGSTDIIDSEANISITSNSDLYVPGKLHIDIVSLRTEYLRIINALDIKNNSNSDTHSIENNIELLTDEQLKSAHFCQNAYSIVYF